MRSISRTWNINKFPEPCWRTEGNFSPCKRPEAKQRVDRGSWITICIEEREWGEKRRNRERKIQTVVEGMWELTPSCAEGAGHLPRQWQKCDFCLDSSCCLLLMLPEELTIFSHVLEDKGGNFTFLMETGNAIYFRPKKHCGAILYAPIPQFPLNTFDIPESLVYFCGFQSYI